MKDVRVWWVLGHVQVENKGTKASARTSFGPLLLWNESPGEGAQLGTFLNGALLCAPEVSVGWIPG